VLKDDRVPEKLVLVAEVDDPLERPLKTVAEDIRRTVATTLGVVVGELLLVPKGSLTKTSSGKRRHLHFRDLYLGGGLEVLHKVGTVSPGP
jgi:hypothetical protein